MKRAARILLALLLLPIPATAQRVPNRREAKQGQCVTCQRDRAGRIARDAKARREFMRRTGFPRGRPGYIVDHIVPLACGGPDKPSNMQWQTVAEARAKDKQERKNCR